MWYPCLIDESAGMGEPGGYRQRKNGNRREMMANKISLADQVYDRLCEDFVLKTRPDAGFPAIHKGLNEYKTSAYQIDGVGVVSLIRCNGPFGTRKEGAFIVPLNKEVPILSMNYSRGLGKEEMSIALVNATASAPRYMQFSRVEDGYGKLKNAQMAENWDTQALAGGSGAKSGSNEELSAMLEEYLNAYLRILETAPACDEKLRKQKLSALADSYPKCSQENMANFNRILGDKAKTFVTGTLFGIDR